MKNIDINNSGTIDYNEFVMSAIEKQKLLSKETLKSAFKLFDKDGNGYISINELREFFTEFEYNDNEWEQLILEFDSDGDK